MVPWCQESVARPGQTGETSLVGRAEVQWDEMNMTMKNLNIAGAMKKNAARRKRLQRQPRPAERSKNSRDLRVRPNSL